MANNDKQRAPGRRRGWTFAGQAFGAGLALLCGLAGVSPAAGAAMAFIPIGAYNQVVTIDLSNNQIVGYTNVGVNPVAIAVSQSTPLAYVSNWGNNSVSVFDTDTRAVVGTITVQNNPRGIAVSPDGSTVLVTNLTSHSVSEIDAATRTIRRTIPVADSPGDVVFDPWGSRAYVARIGAGRVAVINVATGTIIADPIACQYPNALAMHPDGSRVFATCPDTGTVAAIDTTTHQVVRTWNLGSRPQGVAVSPDGARLFVTRSEAASLTTIDLATGNVVGAVSVPSGGLSRTWSVGVGPDGTRAYTTDFYGPHVSVVDTANQSLVTQVTVGVTWLRNEVQSLGQFIGGRGILGAPVIGTATAGDASVTVRFSPPVFRGSLPILGYTATCGGQSANGTASPILVTGLPNGVPVTCRVVATNALGTSPQSAPSNEVTPNPPEPPPTPPPPPQLLAVTPIASQTAQVAFTPLPAGGAFPVLEYEARCSPGFFASTGTSSPITVIGLVNGAEYQCGVRARNAIGWGPLSSTLPVTTATVPNLAPLISATGGIGQVTLVFEPPLYNGGAPVLDYTGRCGTVEVTGPASPIVVTGLTNGQTYSCTVVARNRAGFSAPSNAINAFVGMPPGAPVLDAATPGPGHVVLSFTAPASDGGLPVQEYLARCGTTQASGIFSPIVVPGLANGTEVTCTVRARNDAGTGPESNALNATPRAAPGQPQITQATAGDQQIVLQVAVPPDNGSPILSYTGRCAGGETAGSLGPEPIVRLLGLVNGQSYTCTVEAVNAIGTSPPSESVTLVPAGLPDAPVLDTVAPLDGAARLSFNPPNDDGGAAILDYQAECAPGGSSASGPASPIEVTGLVDNQVFRCRVRARNRVGFGAFSVAMPVIPGTSGPIADLAITKTNGAGFVNGADLVDYDIVVSNPGPGAVVDARVQDPLTADFASAVWQCVPANGAECPADGVDGIDARVALPVGSSVHFTFSALPSQGAESPISNVVSVTPPAGVDDPNLANNVASDGPDIRGIFRDGFE